MQQLTLPHNEMTKEMKMMKTKVITIFGVTDDDISSTFKFLKSRFLDRSFAFSLQMKKMKTMSMLMVMMLVMKKVEVVPQEESQSGILP